MIPIINFLVKCQMKDKKESCISHWKKQILSQKDLKNEVITSHTNTFLYWKAPNEKYLRVLSKAFMFLFLPLWIVLLSCQASFTCQKKKKIYIYRKQLEIFLVKMDSSISYLLVQLIPSKVKKPRSKSPLKSWCELVVWKIWSKEVKWVSYHHLDWTDASCKDPSRCGRTLQN